MTREPIEVEVVPQLSNRRSRDTVFCSCRCANAAGRTDDGASYCSCGPGLDCVSIIADNGISDPQLSGSYCIRAGTTYARGEGGPECDRLLENCP